MADNSPDNREIVLNALQTYGGPQKSAGDWIMVCCPFHDDSTPSCGVNVSLNSDPERRFFFHCLGCQEKGPWNKFAERTGLERIQAWKNKDVHSLDLIDHDLEESLLGDSSLSVKSVFKRMGVPEAQPWPTSMDWRGFPGKLIARCGGYIAQDTYKKSIQVVFLVKYANQVRGGVKAIYEKTDKDATAYFTMKGPWINKHGLLFYDQAQELMEERGYRFVCLVEGPRDALRLLYNGIPAVAILGAATLTRSKALMISSLDIDKAYVIPDNDKGGATLWAACKEHLRPVVPTGRVILPEHYDDEEPEKIDPGNMRVYLLAELVEMLKKRHGLRARKVLV